MQRDSIANTFLVATALCLVCSLLVSSAAVGLRPYQEENKIRSRRVNILQAADLYDPEVPLEEAFGKIERRIVSLETGEMVDGSVVDPAKFDPRAAARDPELSMSVPEGAELDGINRHAKYAFVYLVRPEGRLEQVILPIYGKGLWSTIYGFLALDGDLKTIRGIMFYEHGETPGLGGEIESPTWTTKWEGKKAFCDGAPCIEVVRGQVDPDSPEARHQVDGISGATITSRGVSDMVQYWLSDHAFGPFLDRLGG